MAAAGETGGATITVAPSPFLPGIKTGRSITVKSVCDFGEAEKMQKVSADVERSDTDNNRESACSRVSSGEASGEASVEAGEDACTPILPVLQKKATTRSSKKQQTARKIAMNTKPQSSAMKSSAETPHLVQENQAVKRLKLEGGKTRQILHVEPQVLPHKSKLGLTPGNVNISLNTNKMHKDDRKIQMKPKHTLIRPKEPGFKIDQVVGSASVKSTTELEEEMMPKMPKFKAQSLSKKELHIETKARAHQNADSASVASTELSHEENTWKPHLTEPKTPVFQTSLRARPRKMKSSVELELEELERKPKFKARPLNKKIFDSKGDIGVFYHAKKQVTVPQEFHFATNERIPPPPMAGFFDMLSLKSEHICKNKPIPRNTIPKPFHFHTEERGADKEKKHFMEFQHKQLEEETSWIPKANPCPYTTDYPHVTPKPESKQCTKPEPFQLESLVRHEEEMQQEVEEQLTVNREEARMRMFKAQPILKEDPIPVTDKIRKPLTQVQEFNLQSDNRPVARAQFDEKIKEKEMVHKRHREEGEATRMIEEGKAVKQLTRTMVHYVRPAPKFDHPLFPQKFARDITNPKSPNLRVAHRKERQKISNDSVLSSPAASMR